ncbi:hypothetical protein LMO80_14375, partial [Staphylococcus aureus]|nr:hypothetical protein [Staphylococcus aureus]
EELDIPLSRVRIESAPVERIYGNVVAMGDSSLPLHPDSADKTWARALHWIMAKSARGISAPSNVTLKPASQFRFADQPELRSRLE